MSHKKIAIIIACFTGFACGYSDQPIPEKRAVFQTAFGALELPYQELSPGLALVMGDVVFELPREERDHEYFQTHTSGLAFVDTKLWPGGIVPYAVAPSITDLSGLNAAIAHYHATTNIRIVPRTTEPKYVLFQDNGGGGCYAFYGVPQYASFSIVQMAPACQAHQGSNVHELGHVLGLLHEHQRTDRDSFITVHTQNIDPNYLYAFAKDITAVNLTTYDVGSIMHYFSHGFSINGQPTITRLDGSLIPYPVNLSATDSTGLNRLYTADVSAPAVSITSPASGTYSTSQYVQNIAVTGSDAQILKRLTLSLNSFPTANAYNVNQSTFAVTLPANQLFHVDAYAVDAWDNFSVASIRLSTIVDTTAPTAAITLAGTVNHNGTTVQGVQVTAQDNVWVEKLELWVNGNLHSSRVAATSATFWVNLTGGTFTMYGRALDLAPNAGQSSSISVVTPPSQCPSGYKFCSRCCVPQGTNCSDERYNCLPATSTSIGQ